jgi:hypothetical protein
MADVVRKMVIAGFGRMTARNRAIMERALAVIEGGQDWEFATGQWVENSTGEAIYQGIIVARYRTLRGKPRYVLEVPPQGSQVIADPEQLRSLEGGPPSASPSTQEDLREYQLRAQDIIRRLRRPSGT